MAKIQDLRAKTDDQLEGDVVTLKKEGLNLRFQQASGQLNNTNRRRQVRREVAQIKTVLSERKAGKVVASKAKAEPKAKKAAKTKKEA